LFLCFYVFLNMLIGMREGVGWESDLLFAESQDSLPPRACAPGYRKAAPSGLFVAPSARFLEGVFF